MDVQALASEAVQALHRLGLAMAEQRGLEQAARQRLESLVIPASIFLVEPASAELKEEAGRLTALLDARLSLAQKARHAYREGRVYCFWCDAPDCQHSRPSHQGDTFAGYGPTGKPEWVSFVNLCLEEQEPRVDLLYEEPPEVIARVQSASALEARQLPQYGKESLVFRVLGQVVAGLVPIDLKVSRWRSAPSTARVALTLQVLEVSTPVQGPRLRLNLLGLTFDELLEASAEARPREAAERLRRTLQGVRHKLEVLSRKAVFAEQVGEKLMLEAEVLPLLEELAVDVERLFKLPARTQHAHMRHQSRERPTSNALGDVRTAPLDRYFVDEERDTVVVLGPKQRAHVFSPDGRHVTSMQLLPGELERKAQRGRWQGLARERVLEVREVILGATRREVDSGGASDAGASKRGGASDAGASKRGGNGSGRQM
ncbi:MAG: hypothetical protein ACKO6N_23950 [Myxococcota bacterium]